MLVNLSGVAFAYGDNCIFGGVDFAVNEGERLGLIGGNGEGKTTLIKLMLGQLTPTYGTVTVKNGAKIGYLEQNGGYRSGATVYEEMREVFKEDFAAVGRVGELSARLAACDFDSREYNVLSAKLEAVQKFVAARDSYNVDVKIKTVLNGMGFEAFYDRVIDTMSGGEKTRLKLARLLLESPDLLILDEPTNHLDIQTLYWLEDYLAGYKGAVFVVSHDRYFLDRVISKTLEIENKKLTVFAGNYTKYKTLKAERVALMTKEYERQREEVQKLQTYVAKNIVRATTAKSAQSRVKQLDKMELIEKPYVPPKPPKFSFTYDTPPYERVLSVSHLNLEAGGKRLISDGQFTVMRGRKVAIVGENGAGKSTLLKCVTSGANPNVEVGRYVSFAVYDQENANLNADNIVLQELWERHVAYSQTEVRASLARCGLFPEDMDKKVGELSGGERAKLALCVFENTHGNVLVLDEPTNHLDLPARESLERALAEFDGTVLFVSHDRYFITAVADSVLEIEKGVITAYDGGYEGYKAQKEKIAAAKQEEERLARQQKWEEDNRARYRSKKERAEETRRKERMKAIEAEISRLEGREAELNVRLADPTVASDYAKLSAVLKELEEIKNQIESLYGEYEAYLG